MTRNIPLKLWAAPLLLVLACNPGSESAPLEAAPIAPTDPVAALPCIDEDGDGRGFNCDLGSDCNDADAETWQDCAACATPSLGCPCPNDAASVECASAPSISSTGNVLCEVGTRYCRDGAWTACEGLENFELPASALTLYSRARIDPPSDTTGAASAARTASG